MINGANVFITGGAGYLGRHLIEKLYSDNHITCFSRDESKHYLLKKKYPRIDCVVGDIGNPYRLIKAVRDSEAEIGIFAASMKQISACDENPSEAIKTIVHGALNSKEAALENELEAATFISTDKACAATTIYGSAKFLAEQSFLVGDHGNTRLSSCRYGNVTNSTGSVIPLIWDAIRHGYELELYSPDMTRFMLDISDAVNLVIEALARSKVTLVPVIKSFSIKDLFDIYAKWFGLKYKVGIPRVGEKIHEMMINEEESQRTLQDGKLFVVSPYANVGEKHQWSSYGSKDCKMPIEELEGLLITNKFYQ